MASIFVVEAPVGPGLVQESASHVTLTVFLGPERKELFTSVQVTAMAAVVGEETFIVAVDPVNVAEPVTGTAIGTML